MSSWSFAMPKPLPIEFEGCAPKWVHAVCPPPAPDHCAPHWLAPKCPPVKDECHGGDGWQKTWWSKGCDPKPDCDKPVEHHEPKSCEPPKHEEPKHCEPKHETLPPCNPPHEVKNDCDGGHHFDKPWCHNEVVKNDCPPLPCHEPPVHNSCAWTHDTPWQYGCIV